MNKKVRTKKALLIWITAIFVVLILVLSLTSKYVANKFKPLVEEQIKELVLNSTDSLYHIEFSAISINLILSRASLTDVKVVPDTNVFKKLITQKKAPNNIYRIQLDKLNIRDFHLFRLLLKRKLNIAELKLDNPHVVMINQQFNFNEDKQPRPNKSPYDYISAYLKELRIRTISFKNVHFKYVNNNLPHPVVDSLKNLNVTLKDYLIDPHSATDKSRLYLLKDVIINVNNYLFATPDSLYHITLNKLDFAASSGKLNIQSFNIKPRADEMKFTEVAGYPKERYQVELSNISMDGINLPQYILKQELLANEVNVADGTIAVFGNTSIVPNTGTLSKADMQALSSEAPERTGRYPHQLLQKAKGLLYIKTLNLNHIDIHYAAFNRKSQRKGTITFQNTSGTISNVTNVPKYKAVNHIMDANLTSYLMGMGKLNAKFKFDLTAKDGAFSYSGILEKMEGHALNRVTKPLAMIEVRSGEVDRLEFEVKANDHHANGKMTFKYNNLSLALLKKEDDRLVRQGWMSFLANAIILNPSNPRSDGELVTAKIDYERKKNASFFNFIWRSLLQGIKHSVGATVEKEQKIRTQIANFEKMKQDRQERQQRREKRRQLREKEERENR